MLVKENHAKKQLELHLRASDPELQALYAIYKQHYFKYKHALDKKKLLIIEP